MPPLSTDLRERILAAVDHREGSRRRSARRFSVDVSTSTRLLPLRRRTGSLEPRPRGGRTREPARDPAGPQRLRRLVARRPDATLARLRDSLGLTGGLIHAPAV